MKIKNKLLPLVGIGAACASITPIAVLTSCTDNGMINLLKKYVPSGEQHESTSCSAVQATKDYCEQINKDEDKGKTFIQDAIWSKYKFVEYLKNPKKTRVPSFDSKGKISKKTSLMLINSLDAVDFALSNCSVSSKEIETEVGKINFPILTFDMDYRIKYDVAYESEAEHDIGIMTGKINVENVPFLVAPMGYSMEPSVWVVTPAVQVLQDPSCPITNWSIKYSVNMNETEVVSALGALIQSQVVSDVSYTFNMAKIATLTEDEMRLIEMLRYTEIANMSNSAPIGKSMQSATEVEVSSNLSFGVFTLTFYSWYMRPVPTADGSL